MLKRDIVFRGKSIDNGEWVEGTIHFNGKYILSNKHRNNYHEWVEIIPETVGQYTGIDDKHGTKIFEGDIIRESYKGHERIYHVFWDNDYFALRAESEYTSYQLDELLLSHCEVIGNVFENKELLK